MASRRSRSYCAHLAMTCIVCALVSITAKARQEPSLSAQMSGQGPSFSAQTMNEEVLNLMCWVGVFAGSDWYLEASHTIATPSGRNLIPTCGDSNTTGHLEVTSNMQIGEYSRPGIWKCNVSASGQSAAGGSWSGGLVAEYQLTNTKCNCVPAGANFALTRLSNIGFQFAIEDTTQRDRAISWYEGARAWWNPALSWTGAGMRILGSGPWPIYVVDLPGTIKALFTNNGGGSNWQMQLDPDIFTYSDEFAKTLVAHELGHALGVTGHSFCDESRALMASVVNTTHPGLYAAEDCWLWSEYYRYDRTCSGGQ